MRRRPGVPAWPVVTAVTAVTVLITVIAVIAVIALWPWPGVGWADGRPDDGQAGDTPAHRSWPVAGAPGAPRPVVTRGWDPPPSPWAAGHRGVDLGTAAGATVRAVGGGLVSFAGPVAGRGVVTVTLTGTGEPPLRVTYQPVQASVEVGQVVRAGEVVGRVEEGGFHCAQACLHWGLLRGERYLDPLSVLPEWMLRAGRFRLLPFAGTPEPTGGATAGAARDAADRSAMGVPPREPRELRGRVRPGPRRGPWRRLPR